MKIIRSIIFFFSEIDKEKSLEIAKNLKGYVDVEDGKKENPHIDIKQFQNIIIVSKHDYEFTRIINKYFLNNSEAKIYVISNINKITSNYFANFFLYDISSFHIAEIINEDNQ